MDIWQELGMAPSGERAAIRRAYAERLRRVHPEDDPDGFQRLRRAYEAALASLEGARVKLEIKDGPNPNGAGEASEAADATAAELPGPNAAETLAGALPHALPHALPQALPQALPRGDWAALDARLPRILTPLGRGDSAAAVAALESTLQEPLLVNIELRRLFEMRLLAALPNHLPAHLHVPDDFAAAAVRAFRWDQDLRHLPPEYRFFARDLLRAAEGRRHLEKLRQRGRGWLVAYSEDKHPLAARLLTGPYRPRLFDLAALNDGLLRSMSDLLTELRAFYPDAMARELDPRTTAFWLRRIDEEPKGPLAWFRRDGNYFIAILICIFVIMFFAGAAGLDPVTAVSAAGLIAFAVFFSLDILCFLLRTLGRLLAVPRRLKHALSGGLALASAVPGLTAGRPWSDAALSVSFVCFIALGDERDLLAYIRWVLVLWLGTGLLYRLLLGAPPVEAILLGAQLAAFAGLRLRRLLGKAPTDAAEPQ
ncbi:MAG: hypothetical protein OEM59_21945 [Rhodospirillales bacterium]|nr:hypothetical protein [Rhodospirillales bacterium]